MVELADKTVEAAWKIKNLKDYDRRVEKAAQRVDELDRGRGEAALVIYESALVKSGRSLEEIRELVGKFQVEFEDEDEPLTIPRVSGIMSAEGDEWFFGDDDLRVMTGRLLGQFQHRVAQYNYVNEREVLKRWADSHDTRLFIRRRIYETEPIVGVVGGLDLSLVQYLRVAAGGNTLVPTAEVARTLETLGFGEADDEYEVLARAENLSFHLDLPAPIAATLMEDLDLDGVTDFPVPPQESEPEDGETTEAVSPEEKDAPELSGEDVEARRAASEDPEKGEAPSRVQDPQAKEAPGVEEEASSERPAAPERGTEDAPGRDDRR